MQLWYAEEALAVDPSLLLPYDFYSTESHCRENSLRRTVTNKIPQEKDPLAVRIYHLEIMLESSPSDEA
jgi:hypothetical protein